MSRWNPVGAAVSAVRGKGSAWIRGAIMGNERLESHELASAEDPGLFGPGSVVWRVHGDASMLIGGLRSLLLQTLHPLAMAGVFEFSDYREDPWGRLNRTGRFIGATTFGSTATAEQAIAIVKRVHRPVKGTTPDGRPYSASDPHLMLWVHVAEVDSFLASFNRFGDGKLRDAEQDQYVSEMAEIARRLGTDTPPETVAELKASLEAFRAECQAGPQAREAMRFLLNPPVPLMARGTYGLIAAGAVTSLPRWARVKLRLPVPPFADPLAVRPAAKLLTRTLGWLMAAGPRETSLDDRLLVDQ